MATVYHKFRPVLFGLAALYFAVSVTPARAQSFDNAYEYFQAVHHLLGRDSVLHQVDTTGPAGALIMAVNAGIRQVAVDIGITAYDTITIADGTYNYTVNDNFIENELDHMPLKAWYVTEDGVQVFGVSRKDHAEFATDVSGEAVTTRAIGFNLSGNRLWVYPAGEDGASVYLEGPGEGTAIAHGASTTNIYDADEMAVCYWAAFILGTGISHPGTQGFFQSYVDHVQRRGGRVEVPQVGP